MTGKKQTEQTGQEPPRRSSGLISFGADVRKLVGPLLGKKGLLQADILSRWTDILGTELASGVKPFSVSFSKKTTGAVLTVTAFSGAYAVEFTARKPQIIERLNAYFGYAAISDIRIKQGGTFTPPAFAEQEPEISPEKSEELKKLTAGIEDESLRASVIRLGTLLTESKKD